MSKYEQLIAKAMSTESASEAFNCLQMAKKYKSQSTTDGGKYEGHTAKEWAHMALDMQRIKDDYHRLYEKYHDKAKFLRLENEDLGEKCNSLTTIAVSLGVVCFLMFIIMVV